MQYLIPTSGQPPLRSLTSRIRRWFSQHSPPGLPGGAASTTATAPNDVPSPTGLRPYCHGRNLGEYQKSGTDSTATGGWPVRGNGIEGIQPAKSRRREEEWPKHPGFKWRGAMTGRQGREPRTTEQPSRNPPQSSNHGHHFGRCPARCLLGSPGHLHPVNGLVTSTKHPLPWQPRV